MQVIGPVWGTRRAEGLQGVRLLSLRSAAGAHGVAVDALGAGPGEWVLVAHGSRVRDLTVGAAVADKDVVVAIVDSAEPSEALSVDERRSASLRATDNWEQAT